MSNVITACYYWGDFQRAIYMCHLANEKVGYSSGISRVIDQLFFGYNYIFQFDFWPTGTVGRSKSTATAGKPALRVFLPLLRLAFSLKFR